MISKERIQEIREYLEAAQNPIFFFDNDADGLCSFLLLRKFCGKGKGVCIKGELSEDYFRKIEEFKSDYVFILDKALVSKDFYLRVHERNLPIICIDHHNYEESDIPEFVHYYNPLENGLSVPVTDVCYDISKQKEDLWIAVVGCIGDRFVPPFYEEFENRYPDLSCKYADAFDLRYKAKVGEIVKIFNFALKDKITNVISMLKFLINVRSPYEIFEENSKNYAMHKRFNFINNKYTLLLKKAIEKDRINEKVLFFRYSGDMSISSDLSDELSYILSEKLIVVAYVKDSFANISIRGKNARKFFEEATKELEGVGGGGHDCSVGVRMNAKFLDDFEKNLKAIAQR